MDSFSDSTCSRTDFQTHRWHRASSGRDQEEFWITQGREAVRKVLRSCVKCRRLRNKTTTQQMGPIWDIGVPDETSYAFKYTAVDAAGPFLAKMPRAMETQTIPACVYLLHSPLYSLGTTHGTGH